mgnify:CR=1 FL=1
MASPSRSGSDARYTASARLTLSVINFICFSLPGIICQRIAKSCSVSTLPFSGTKSRTCPTDAMTCHPAPRYFSIVLAFDGDSTISKFISNFLWQIIVGLYVCAHFHKVQIRTSVIKDCCRQRT